MNMSTEMHSRVRSRHAGRLLRTILVAATLIPTALVGGSVASAVTPTPRPQITSLVPTTAPRGAHIAIYGTNLRSANGLVYATFAGYGSYTRCPLVTRCNVLVPTYLRGRVPVRIHTQTGTSNYLWFTYR